MVVAEVLKFQDHDPKDTTYTFELYHLVRKRILRVHELQPSEKEFSEEELREYSLFLACHEKKELKEIRSKLRQYMDKYDKELKHFMPVFHAYFRLVADKDSLFAETPDGQLEDRVEEEIERIEEEIAKKIQQRTEAKMNC